MTTAFSAEMVENTAPKAMSDAPVPTTGKRGMNPSAAWAMAVSPAPPSASARRVLMATNTTRR
jgi:hypothetical protein